MDKELNEIFLMGKEKDMRIYELDWRMQVRILKGQGRVEKVVFQAQESGSGWDIQSVKGDS